MQLGFILDAVNSLILYLVDAMTAGLAIVLQIISTGILDLLKLDTSLFARYFPLYNKAESVFYVIAFALILFLFMFNVFKNFAAQIIGDVEQPLVLVGKVLIFSFLIVNAKSVTDIAMGAFRVPFNLIAGDDLISMNNISKMIKMDTNIQWSDSTEAIDFGDLGSDGMNLVLTLLTLAVMIIIVVNFFKLLIEVAERYLVMCILYMFAPMAFAMGVSKTTDNVFKGWVRMYASSMFMMVLNVWSIKLALTSIANRSGASASANAVRSSSEYFTWAIVTLAFLKAAQSLDEYLNSMGLSTARTGRSMLDDIVAGGKALAGAGKMAAGMVKGAAKGVSKAAGGIGKLAGRAASQNGGGNAIPRSPGGTGGAGAAASGASGAARAASAAGAIASRPNRGGGAAGGLGAAGFAAAAGGAGGAAGENGGNPATAPSHGSIPRSAGSSASATGAGTIGKSSGGAASSVTASGSSGTPSVARAGQGGTSSAVGGSGGSAQSTGSVSGAVPKAPNGQPASIPSSGGIGGTGGNATAGSGVSDRPAAAGNLGGGKSSTTIPASAGGSVNVGAAVLSGGANSGSPSYGSTSIGYGTGGNSLDGATSLGGSPAASMHAPTVGGSAESHPLSSDDYAGTLDNNYASEQIDRGSEAPAVENTPVTQTEYAERTEYAEQTNTPNEKRSEGERSVNNEPPAEQKSTWYEEYASGYVEQENEVNAPETEQPAEDGETEASDDNYEEPDEF